MLTPCNRKTKFCDASAASELTPRLEGAEVIFTKFPFTMSPVPRLTLVSASLPAVTVTVAVALEPMGKVMLESVKATVSALPPPPPRTAVHVPLWPALLVHVPVMESSLADSVPRKIAL